MTVLPEEETDDIFAIPSLTGDFDDSDDRMVASSENGTIVLRIQAGSAYQSVLDLATASLEIGRKVNVMSPCGNMWPYCIASWACGVKIRGHVVCNGDTKDLITGEAATMLCNENRLEVLDG